MSHPDFLILGPPRCRPPSTDLQLGDLRIGTTHNYITLRHPTATNNFPYPELYPPFSTSTSELIVAFLAGVAAALDRHPAPCIYLTPPYQLVRAYSADEACRLSGTRDARLIGKTLGYGRGFEPAVLSFPEMVVPPHPPIGQNII